jgi:hypothetical protein
MTSSTGYLATGISAAIVSPGKLFDRTMRQKMYVIAALLLGTCGCGLWERKLVFTGSVGGDSLEIKQPFPINEAGIRIILNHKNFTKTVYEVRGDTFLAFVDVAWSSGDTAVALFECGFPRSLAYETDDANPIPFVRMEATVAAHIRVEYRLDPKLTDKEVFDWACSTEGVTAFSKLYPQARAR